MLFANISKRCLLLVGSNVAGLFSSCLALCDDLCLHRCVSMYDPLPDMCDMKPSHLLICMFSKKSKLAVSNTIVESIGFCLEPMKVHVKKET